MAAASFATEELQDLPLAACGRLCSCPAQLAFPCDGLSLARGCCARGFCALRLVVSQHQGAAASAWTAVAGSWALDGDGGEIVSVSRLVGSIYKKSC